MNNGSIELIIELCFALKWVSNVNNVYSIQFVFYVEMSLQMSNLNF